MAETYTVTIVIDANNQPVITKLGQVETKLRSGVGGAAKQGFGNASREASGLLTNVGNLERAIQGVMTAFAGQQLLQAVGELRAVGDEVRFAKLAFEEMVGGPDAAREALARMREETHYVIDDVTLMRESTKLQLLGLADDVGEASTLFSTLSKIARITGQDVGSALSVFQLTIANTSYQRLDSLGLSMEKVKARAEELEAAGLSAEAAFRQAVVEGMEGVVDQIGAAATAGETAFAKWEVRIKNLRDQLGLVVSDSIETALQLAELGTLMSTASAGGNQNGFPFFGGSWVAGRLGTNPGGISGGAGLAAQLTGMGDRIEFERNYTALRQRIADSAFASVAANLSGFMSGITNPDAAYWRDVAARRQRSERMNASLVGASNGYLELQALTQGYNSINPRRGAFGNQVLFTEADARRAEEIARQLESIYQMAQNNPDLVSEESLTSARNMAEQGRQWQEYVEAGVKALENMSLADLFGQGGGGRLGEVGDAVVEGMRAAGMSDDQIAAYQDLMDLTSGRETALSQNFEQEVVPGIVAIFERFGEDAAVEASAAYERGLSNFRLANITPANPFGLTGYLNLGGGGTSYTVQPNDGYDALARGLGMTRDDLFSRGILRPGQVLHPGESYGTGMQLAPMPGVTAPWGPGAYDFEGMDFGGAAPAQTMFDPALEQADALYQKVTDIEGAFTNLLPPAISTAADSISGASAITTDWKGVLDEMAAAEYELRFKLVADSREAPPWLTSLIDSRITTVTRANGGRAPGSIQRTRD